ncbi:MAG TPA: Gmad2 immunoglobulin-like domain-containing protein, partial [Candidatus Tumulicola sp.]
RVTGRGRTGLPFDNSWTFTVRRSGPPQISLTIRQPEPDAVVGRSFTVAGTYAPNSNVRVTAGASQSATGQFNGNTTAGPRGNFQITVNLKQLMGQQSVTVRIMATDPNSSQTAEKTMQLRFRPNASAANQ